MWKYVSLAFLGLITTLSQAQQSGYSQNNLVANTAGVANNTDSQLSNPWGIALIPGQPFWIADNNSGVSTLYDSSGNKNSLVVQIPTASVNPCSPGCPTGVVGNTTSDFGGAFFIYDTEDGILASWTAGTAAVKVVDNSSSGAVYKGLALLSNGTANFLLAANFNSGHVDVFDRSFNQTSLSGSFSDPNLPAGYAPHGIHIINNQVFVTYGLQDSAKHDPVVGAGNGVVDIFDQNGNFVQRFATGGVLNAPWGVAMSPAGFGQFSNVVLVGNFGDGTIHAFDANGNSLGTINDTNGNQIVNPGLWELLFGSTSSDADTLYFTAGGANQTSGLFATLKAAQTVTAGDFSLSVSSTSLSVAPGAAAILNISASAVGGFDSAITLSCSGLPAGVSCAFSPATITPGTNNATSVLSLSVSQGYPFAMWLPLSGIGLFGLAFLSSDDDSKRQRLLKRSALAGTLLMAVVLLLVVAGCGSNSGNHNNTTGGGTPVTNFLITGTSGNIQHSVQIGLTVQ